MHRSAVFPVEDRCPCGEDARRQTDSRADFVRVELPRRCTIGTKSIRRIGNQGGEGIKNESDFYPWGGELQFLVNDSNHYKFTGKERDSESGLDYFGARYYSNGLGRFIRADWSSTPIPVPYADLGDPQSLNLYSYVRNIPTTHFDLDGHDGWEEFKFVMKAVKAVFDTEQKVAQSHATGWNEMMQTASNAAHVIKDVASAIQSQCECSRAQQNNNSENSNNSNRTNENESAGH